MPVVIGFCFLCLCVGIIYYTVGRYLAGFPYSIVPWEIILDLYVWLYPFVVVYFFLKWKRKYNLKYEEKENKERDVITTKLFGKLHLPQYVPDTLLIINIGSFSIGWITIVWSNVPITYFILLFAVFSGAYFLFEFTVRWSKKYEELNELKLERLEIKLALAEQKIKLLEQRNDFLEEKLELINEKAKLLKKRE
ncbi:hypothetical protein [Thermoflavimicrobium daqui]|jgi:hypothetical protein|uniref:Uncharacterized protein n=1 Tax=Thermoflavimicrobium daqui TaxID=2137476 RepID=A0A364K123_9BACL|nr:hypothetical protein [Thermoflavimicrobium daqui]RAL21392.1 hypothetical protein DL897_16770 [Thermoflavimicrobium daqui]